MLKKKDIKKIILLIFLINIVNMVNSAPVTDLNLFTVTQPAFYIGTDINFGLNWIGEDANNIYWKFGTDTNIIDSSITAERIIDDNFNNGNYTSPVNFTVQSGTWDASTFSLEKTNSGAGAIISTPTGDVNFLRPTVWEWLVTTPSSTPYDIRFGIITNDDGSGNGYSVLVESGGNGIFLRRITGGSSGANQITKSGISTDTNYLIRLERGIDGNFNMFVDGVSQGTVIDNTFTDMNHIVLQETSNTAGAKFDNISSYYSDITPMTLSSPSYKTNSFSTTGIKKIQVTVQTGDNNVSTSLDINIFAKLKLTAYDENTNTILTNASINFNGTDYNLSTDGNISIDLNGITPGEYEITLDVNSEYTQRVFLLDLNEFFPVDKNITSLRTVQGQDIEFKIYDTDESTLLNAAKIEFVRNGINKTSTIQKTDSTGNITVFLQTDSDYNLLITKSNGSALIYFPTLITVLPPKREEDATTISPINFDITVSGLAQQEYAGQTGSKTFAIFSNTINPYQVFVDVNSDFYQRKYSIQTFGDTTTYELQPYMVSVSTGASMTLKTQRYGDYLPIPDTTIKVFKYITGEGRVLLENVITDSKGEAFVSGTINEDYDFEVYFNNNLVDNFSITVTSTTIYFRFDPASISSLNQNSYLNVLFNPNTVVLDINQTTLTQTITFLNETISKIEIYAKYIDFNGDISDLNLYTNTITAGIVNNYENTITINTELTTWDTNKTLLVYVTLTNSSGVTFTKKQSYIYQYNVLTSFWTYLTSDIKTSLACTGELCPFLMLIGLLISLGVAGSFYFSSPVSEPQTIILFNIFLVLFTLITWMHWSLTLVSILTSIFYLSSNRSK